MQRQFSLGCNVKVILNYPPLEHELRSTFEGGGSSPERVTIDV